MRNIKNFLKSMLGLNTQPQVQTEKLTFITYNVWFENHHFEERCEELVKIFLQYQPDVICLQEVTPNFQAIIGKSDQLKSIYRFSNNSIKGYGVMILCKYDFMMGEQKFMTNMGRSLLYGTLKVNNENFAFGTVHLESLNNEPLRKGQLKISLDILRQHENSVLMGDFNFDNELEDPRIEENGFQDIWKLLKHKNEENFTMKQTTRFPAWRPDRFIINSKSTWQPTRIERIGMDPIPSYKNPSKVVFPDVIQTPSDHFGLYIEIQKKQ